MSASSCLANELVLQRIGGLEKRWPHAGVDGHLIQPNQHGFETLANPTREFPLPAIYRARRFILELQPPTEFVKCYPQTLPVPRVKQAINFFEKLRPAQPPTMFAPE